MAQPKSKYQRIPSPVESEDAPPTIITVRHDDDTGQWSHIGNLDDFFTRVYEYFQHKGFWCIVANDMLDLLQFLFITGFTFLLWTCVDYTVLFDDNPKWSSVIRFDRNSVNFFLVTCLIMASCVFSIRSARALVRFFKAKEMSLFYRTVLKIQEGNLQNILWHDVLLKLKEAQQLHRMCIHKADITELDVNHRILRHKNFLIALQNKNVLNYEFYFPFFGRRSFLSESLRWNIHFILFLSPKAPFAQSWRLKDEYKIVGNRELLARRMERHILLVGLANILLCPFVLIWQLLYSMFQYGEMAKRAPAMFGTRRWSNHARLFFRHFSELDHEFNSRLNKAYEPAVKYVNSFYNPLLAIIARRLAFFAGAFLLVPFLLSMVDHSVLSLDHVLTIMAVSGIVVKVCSACLPEENTSCCPEKLMKEILQHTHYVPEAWKGRAHSSEVAQQFCLAFQYKFVYLLEELVSPIVTPLVLIFSIRHRALQIIDFLRMFTVEVVGVGDVCSFAQLDVRRHGHPGWLSAGMSEANRTQQAEYGKTELSLLRFAIKNPDWKPDATSQRYLVNIRSHAMRESLSMSSSLQRPYHESQLASSSTDVHDPLDDPLPPLGNPSDLAYLSTTQQSQAFRATHWQQPALIGSQDDTDMNSSLMTVHELRDRTQTTILDPAMTSTGSFLRSV